MPKKPGKGKKRDDGFDDEDEDERRLEEKMKSLLSDGSSSTAKVKRTKWTYTDVYYHRSNSVLI